MKEFSHDKNQEIVPRILGGVSVPVGILLICLWLLSIFALFFPRFRMIKIIYIGAFDGLAYLVASFIDVSNNGISNVIKKMFSQNIEAVKIKKTNLIRKKDDPARERH